MLQIGASPLLDAGGTSCVKKNSRASLSIFGAHSNKRAPTLIGGSIDLIPHGTREVLGIRSMGGRG